MLLLLGFSKPALADRFLELRAEARAAAGAGELERARRAFAGQVELAPSIPKLHYNLACMQARLGLHEAALAQLEIVAEMGISFDIAADTDLSSLKDLPAFAKLLERLAHNRRPIGASALLAALPREDLIPEDLAWDARRKRWLVSSVRQRERGAGRHRRPHRARQRADRDPERHRTAAYPPAAARREGRRRYCCLGARTVHARARRAQPRRDGTRRPGAPPPAPALRKLRLPAPGAPATSSR